MALLFLYALVQPCLSQEKSCMVGIGLASLLHNYVEVSVCYGFEKHWSVTGEAAISYEGFMHKESSTELEHKEEFCSDPSLPRAADRHCERILFSFWPAGSLNGIHFSAGVQSGSGSGIDMLTAVGYTFEIWKSLRMTGSIQIPILDGIRQRHISARNIKVGIQYKF